MIDYSKLSDFEINKLVAESINSVNNDGSEFEKFFADALIHQTKIGVIDYCNNPSDAWSIIFDNNICITFRKNKTSLISAYNDCPNECVAGKELREAMIVYLMMREGK